MSQEDFEEIEVGPKGGAGSKIPWYELLDSRALEVLAGVFTHGAQKYARDNWRAVPVEEHIRHALRHCFKALEPQQQYTTPKAEEFLDELSHACCRVFMALACELQDTGVEDLVPKGLNIPAKGTPHPSQGSLGTKETHSHPDFMVCPQCPNEGPRGIPRYAEEE